MNKKLLTLSLAITLATTNIVPSFAIDSTSIPMDGKNSKEEIEYYEPVEAGEYGADVYAIIGSEYKVTIPKFIVLSGIKKSADYKVTVTGDIAGNESIIVKPDENFNLNSINKNIVLASVSQDRIAWRCTDLDDVGTGTVNANELTAGKWSGTFNFNINIDANETNIKYNSLSTLNSNLSIAKNLSDNIKVFYKSADVTKDCIFNSEDTSIATVSNDGLVTGMKLGSTQINISYKTENSTLHTAVDVEIVSCVHKWNLQSSSEATCVLPSEEKYICEICQDEKIEHKTPAKGHTESEPVQENKVEQTFDKNGSYEEVIYCAVCGEEISRTEKEIDNAGLYDENNKLLKTWDELLDDGTLIMTSDNKLKTNYKYENDTASNDSSDALNGKLIISKDIKEMDSYAFAYCTNLKEVVISSPKMTVGGSTFRGCANLTSVTMPDNFTKLPGSCFYDCVNLKRINSDVDGVANLPKTLKNTNNWTFRGCTSLTTFNFPQTLETIGVGTFVDTGAVNLDIPDGVTSIGDRAFGWNNKLETLKLPSSLKTVDKQLCNYCPKLQSVEIPDGVTEILAMAFKECTSLQSVTMSNSVTSIDSSVFLGDKALTELQLSKNIKSIGDSAFRNCSSLTNIELPNGIEIIPNYLFGGCTSLKTIKLPSSLKQIGEWSFDGTAIEYLDIPFGTETVSETFLRNCNNLKGVTFPDTVKVVSYVFKDLKTLQYVKFGSGLEQIGAFTFSGINKNIDIYYNGTQAAWNNVTKAQYWDYTITYNLYCSSGVTEVYVNDAVLGQLGIDKTTDKDIVIPGTYEKNGSKYKVVGIADYAFEECDNLESITLGEGIETIGYASFIRCKNLKTVNLPNTITKIDDYAFQYDSALKNVTFGNSLESIGYASFGDCTSLLEVNLPDSMLTIGKYAFQSNTSLKKITFGNSLKSIDYAGVASCPNITEIILPASIETIGEFAFDYDTGLATMRYTGTKSQWNSVKKGEYYLQKTNVKTIICSDGNVSV